MPNSKLTESQKRVLKWLINEAYLGKLDENEINILFSLSGTSILGYEDEVPEINEMTLDLLEKEGFLICHRSQHSYRCSLTGLAYEAVDNNFNLNRIERNDSFVDYLNDFKEITHLDEELKQRCLFSITNDPTNPKAWDKAIRTATVILENRLRDLGETDKIDPNATGDTIVNITFSEKGKIAALIGQKKAKAYRDLYAGLMLVFRNQYNHRLVDPKPNDGAAIIQFINLSLKMLGDIKK